VSNAAVETLNTQSVAWNAWQGLDREGLQTTFLLVQSGSYVNLIVVSCLPPAADYALMVIDVLAIKVARGNLGSELPADSLVVGS
jgi:hypothetical protein